MYDQWDIDTTNYLIGCHMDIESFPLVGANHV